MTQSCLESRGFEMGGITAKSELSRSVSVTAWSDTMTLCPANAPNKPTCQQRQLSWGCPVLGASSWPGPSLLATCNCFLPPSACHLSCWYRWLPWGKLANGQERALFIYLSPNAKLLKSGHFFSSDSQLGRDEQVPKYLGAREGGCSPGVSSREQPCLENWCQSHFAQGTRLKLPVCYGANKLGSWPKLPDARPNAEALLFLTSSTASVSANDEETKSTGWHLHFDLCSMHT